MAFSLSIDCTGSNPSLSNNRCGFCSCAPRPTSVSFAGDRSRSRRRNNLRITAAAAAMAVTDFRKECFNFDLETRGGYDREEENDFGDVSDRLDRWMRDSVVEIVKNLREAPLLVQVFTKDGGNDDNGGRLTVTATETATLVTEKKATEENWPLAREKWRQNMVALPEGLILVEELNGEDEIDERDRTDGSEGTTKVWGVVVQGRRARSGPVCYLLKTTRVGVGSAQAGPWCTHYCLTRVKNFRETVDSQFINLWLVQGQS